MSGTLPFDPFSKLRASAAVLLSAHTINTALVVFVSQLISLHNGFLNHTPPSSRSDTTLSSLRLPLGSSLCLRVALA